MCIINKKITKKVIFLERDETIKIEYHDKTVKKICTDFKKAKRQLPLNVAEKLYALLEFIESSESLWDVFQMYQFHLHPLKGELDGKYAIDIVGRRSGYRLIIIPLDQDGKDICVKDKNIVYKMTRITVIWEVSNHYE